MAVIGHVIELRRVWSGGSTSTRFSSPALSSTRRTSSRSSSRAMEIVSPNRLNMNSSSHSFPACRLRGRVSSKHCRWKRRLSRRARSSWYGKTRRAACRDVRRCARQNSRAAPAAGWRGDGPNGSRRSRPARR